MNKGMLVLTAIAVLSASTIAAAGSAGVNGYAQPLDAGAPVLSNQGQTLCTAAINSDGSKAGGLHVSSSSAVATGQYAVVFSAPCTKITAKLGWARWVQVDTLSSGSIAGVTCSTADDYGDANGVYVNCTDTTGASVATSFFLFVAR